MNELERFYATIDSPAKPVIERFGGDQKMAGRFIMKFTEDASFRNLADALAGNQQEEAFRAAHTLKGISVSLGFEKLFEKSSHITELLRNGDIDGAKVAYPELENEYFRVIDAVKALMIC